VLTPAALAARLRAPYRLALGAPLGAALAGVLWLALAAPAPAALPEDAHVLLSAASVGAAFLATLLSRALLAPGRVAEAEDPARHVWGACVLTWALCAAGALAGLALCLLTGDLGDLGPSATLAFLTALAHPPSEARLRAALGARSELPYER